MILYVWRQAGKGWAQWLHVVDLDGIALRTLVRYAIINEGWDTICMDRVTPKQVIVYADDKGREPFTEWLNNLRDSAGRKRILARLSRLALGNNGV